LGETRMLTVSPLTRNQLNPSAVVGGEEITRAAGAVAMATLGERASEARAAKPKTSAAQAASGVTNFNIPRRRCTMPYMHLRDFMILSIDSFPPTAKAKITSFPKVSQERH